MAVVLTNKVCECGHSQLAHFISADDCVIRTTIFDTNELDEVIWNSERSDTCPCKKYVPTA